MIEAVLNFLNCSFMMLMPRTDRSDHATGVRQERLHSSTAPAFAPQFRAGLFDDLRSEWGNVFVGNCDDQASSALEPDFERRRFNLDTTLAEPNLEGGPRFYARLLPDFFGDDKPSSRIHGSFHTIDHTIEQKNS
jgi:hypothetical protein